MGLLLKFFQVIFFFFSKGVFWGETKGGELTPFVIAKFFKEGAFKLKRKKKLFIAS